MGFQRSTRLACLVLGALVTLAPSAKADVLWDQSDYNLTESGFLNSVESGPRIPIGWEESMRSVNDVSVTDRWVINQITSYYRNAPDWGANVFGGALIIFPKVGSIPTTLEGYYDLWWGTWVPMTATLVGDHYEVVASGLNVVLEPGDYWIGIQPDAGWTGADGPNYQLRSYTVIGDGTVTHDDSGFPFWFNMHSPPADAAFKIEGAIFADASLALQPEDIPYDLGQGGHVTSELLIYNVATAPASNLEWNLSEITCSWLSISPTSGSIPPGGSASVTVTVDATDLVPGFQECELLLASNDPFAPFAGIPYYITVFADCDGSGTTDADEIVANPGLDCNDNGFLDSCEIAGMTPAGGLPRDGSSYDVATDGTYAYVSNADADRVDVLDVTDPGSPTLVATGSVPGRPVCSLPVGDHLYVASGTGLHVLDLSNVSPPPSVATLTTVGFSGEPFAVEGIVHRGDHLYLPGGDATLEFWVMSIADRANPVVAGTLNLPEAPRDVVLSGDYAFVSALYGGMLVVDVTDPANPFLVSQLATPENGAGIARLGDDHVLVTDPSSFQVVDVSQPTAPVIVASVPQLNNARNVHVDGAIAYIATADGLLAYDMSAPSAPVLMDQVVPPAEAYQAAVVQDRLVAACSTYGVVVYNPLALDANGDAIPDECETPTAVPAVVPASFALHSAIPNPFNPSTTIRFDLPQAGAVDLTIYDVSGRQVRTLVRETRPAGRHDVIWRGLDDRGRRVTSGVYLCRLTSGSYVETQRMTMLK